MVPKSRLFTLALYMNEILHDPPFVGSWVFPQLSLKDRQGKVAGLYVLPEAIDTTKSNILAFGGWHADRRAPVLEIGKVGPEEPVETMLSEMDTWIRVAHVIETT